MGASGDEGLLPEGGLAGRALFEALIAIARSSLPKDLFREIIKVACREVASRIFNMMLFITSKYFVSS